MASINDLEAAVRKERPNDRWLISYASTDPVRNGIVVAGFGYWHKLTSEEWDHFRWLKSDAGNTIFKGLEIFVPSSDRSYDIMRDICLVDGVAQGEQAAMVDPIDYDRIKGLIKEVAPDKA